VNELVKTAVTECKEIQVQILGEMMQLILYSSVKTLHSIINNTINNSISIIINNTNNIIDCV